MASQAATAGHAVLLQCCLQPWVTAFLSSFMRGHHTSRSIIREGTFSSRGTVRVPVSRSPGIGTIVVYSGRATQRVIVWYLVRGVRAIEHGWKMPRTLRQVLVELRRTDRTRPRGTVGSDDKFYTVGRKSSNAIGRSGTRAPRPFRRKPRTVWLSTTRRKLQTPHSSRARAATPPPLCCR